MTYLFNYWDRYGGATGQHRRYNGIRIYILYGILFVSHSRASTFIISKYIKLLFFKSITVLQSYILFYIFELCHIMELFIYAFKFQFIVKI